MVSQVQRVEGALVGMGGGQHPTAPSLPIIPQIASTGIRTAPHFSVFSQLSVTCGAAAGVKPLGLGLA